MGTKQALVLYDGLCGFCNGTVRWLLAHDVKNVFQFAPQQSAIAEEILRRHGIARDEMLRSNSVYLVLDRGSAQERLLVQSDVAVAVLALMGGWWKLVGKLMQAIPQHFRNAGYRLVARNRFRISGRSESCPVPSEPDRVKFLGL